MMSHLIGGLPYSGTPKIKSCLCQKMTVEQRCHTQQICDSSLSWGYVFGNIPEFYLTIGMSVIPSLLEDFMIQSVTYLLRASFRCLIQSWLQRRHKLHFQHAPRYRSQRVFVVQRICSMNMKAHPYLGNYESDPTGSCYCHTFFRYIFNPHDDPRLSLIGPSPFPTAPKARSQRVFIAQRIIPT